MVYEYQTAWKLNRTHQLLAHVDDINLGNNTDTIKRRTETLIYTSKVVGVEVNAEETKQVLLPRHQTAGQAIANSIANGSFENVAEFKYLGAIVINQI
jgi:hypothetical protein